MFPRHLGRDSFVILLTQPLLYSTAHICMVGYARLVEVTADPRSETKPKNRGPITTRYKYLSLVSRAVSLILSPLAWGMRQKYNTGSRGQLWIPLCRPFPINQHSFFLKEVVLPREDACWYHGYKLINLNSITTLANGIPLLPEFRTRGLCGRAPRWRSLPRLKCYSLGAPPTVKAKPLCRGTPIQAFLGTSRHLTLLF
jgi:hypothetical protein